MEKNIKIAYILAFCRNSWFWLGIWIFYYLSFTDYAGIGIIETVFYGAIVVSEIPTGAIADLLGKKRTLILSFALMAIGIYIMSFAKNMSWILIGAPIAGIGGSFYSGTVDALIYDSLKQIGKNDKYDKVQSNLTSITLIGPAVCGILGGFLYSHQHNLPFLLNAIFYTVAFVFCFFLIEPRIDTEKFSLSNFIKQLPTGFHQLVKSEKIINQTILLVSIGLVTIICSESLHDFMVVELGYKPAQLGIFFSVLYILAALANQLTQHIKRYVSYIHFMYIVGFVIALSLIISPILGIVLGSVVLTLRMCLQNLSGTISTIIINDNTDSKYRATTLSTFNLIKNIPYVLMAYGVGSLAQSFSALRLAMYLGIFLFVLVVIQFTYKTIKS